MTSRESTRPNQIRGLSHRDRLDASLGQTFGFKVSITTRLKPTTRTKAKVEDGSTKRQVLV